MIPAQELVEHGAGRRRRARGRRVRRAGRGGQPRRRPLRAEHDHDQRGAPRPLRERDRGRRRRRPARRAGPVSSGPTAWREMVAAALADAAAAPPAEDASALVEPSQTPGRRATSALAPEETDAVGARGRALGALGRLRAGPCPRRGAGRLRRARRRDALPGQLDRGAALARAADGGGEPGRPHGRRDGLGLGRARPTIDPSFEEMEQEVWRRLDWATRQIAARGRALRGDPAAVGRGRHDGRARLRRPRRPGRRGRPHRLLQGGRRDAGRRDGSPRCPSRSTATRSSRGVECAPFVATDGQRARSLRLRQRPARSGAPTGCATAC